MEPNCPQNEEVVLADVLRSDGKDERPVPNANRQTMYTPMSHDGERGTFPSHLPMEQYFGFSPISGYSMSMLVILDPLMYTLHCPLLCEGRSSLNAAVRD